MHLLLTGGAGYIGSHTAVVLLEAGYKVTIVDNLCNSNSESINRIRKITNCAPDQLQFLNADLRVYSELEVIFKTCPKFDACIHFAGLKAVGESVEKPLLYYENNLIGTLHLLSLMEKYDCRNIVFSSSATVYGFVPSPIREDTPTGTGITNCYGRTKYMIEEIIKDHVNSKVVLAGKPNTAASTQFRATILRYFNPVGAHPSGLIGEDPYGVPNNLMPFVAQVAVGRREYLTIFGNDYNTPDGTGVRDYIHVMDLAEGHKSAINHILKVPQDDSVVFTYNLGTGCGCSVLDMVHAMEKACGHEIKYVIGARRSGDIDVCYADVSKSKTELQWVATKTLDDMCRDLWNWQSLNPLGYHSGGSK